MYPARWLITTVVRWLLVFVLTLAAVALVSRAAHAGSTGGQRARKNPWSSGATSTVFKLKALAPGCYPSGSVVGTKGETITVVRASGAYYFDVGGALQNCASNNLRVGPNGLIHEPGSTQLHPSPSAPAAGTVTFTSTGTHVFWVKGSGSQTISLGTATGTGFPCTATEGSYCTLNVTATGTATVGAVTGTLTLAQVEKNLYPTGWTAISRNAETLTITNPLKTTDTRWCVVGTYQPTGSWAPTGVRMPLWSFGDGLAANTASQEGIGGRLYGQVADGSAVAKGSDYTSVPFASGSQHTVAYCNNAGVMQVYADGVAVGTTTGSGTGLFSAIQSVSLGARSAYGSHFYGVIKDFRICKTASPTGACR